MKMTIERTALLKTLGHVQSVVERRNTIPILSNVLLDARGGRVSMTATDLDIQIVDSVAADVEVEGTTTVQANMLFDIVRKLSDGSQVQLHYSDGRLKVVSGRSRFEVPCLPADDFPMISRGGFEHSITMTTSALKDLLQRTRYAMSSEETRYYLNGIFLHVVDDRLVAAATDGHRLARATADTGESPVNGMPDVIMPRKAVGELFKLLGEFDGEVEIGVSKTKIGFDIGNLQLTTKVIDGTFPDYSRVIPQNNSILVTADVKSMVSAVERVTVVASEKTRAVRLNVDGEVVVLSVTSPDNGTANDEVACDSNGKVEIGFNSKYLTDTLDEIRSENVEIHFADSASPVLVIDPARPDDRNVLMPMRV